MCFKYFMLSNILWYEVLKVCRTPGKKKKNMNWLFKIYFSCQVYFLVSQLLELLFSFPLHYDIVTCLASCARARSPPRVRAREPRSRICRSFSRWISPDENNSVDKLLFRVACLEIRLHQDCSGLWRQIAAEAASRCTLVIRNEKETRKVTISHQADDRELQDGKC